MPGYMETGNPSAYMYSTIPLDFACSKDMDFLFCLLVLEICESDINLELKKLSLNE